ncbi:ABC-F family ATP-binding cassette domain-containing protein [Fodinicola acaciae]|uniref:ABC-F family ATP-binding cassette domain-containing protein n=1 Tax=Fodinicola acaciae TaxID=2681555 RepID=UPI0013D24C9C|nr:ABC-F family ATP-binding cassette domain-containing protein [Fodinicola acaciae]
MANLVNLERVGKTYGTTVPLDGVSLGIAAAQRVGVVGLNGAGKSTLLRMVTGAEQPDSGRVARRGGLRLGSLDQQLTLPAGATVRDVVLGSAWLSDDLGAEHEWASDARVREILDGLGLGRIGLDTVVDPLSGGEKRRVGLAGLLVRDLDLLVLDEPTNHLDVEGVGWLARHLNARNKIAVLVVTHDRWFLDEVCQTTWEVVDASVQSYDGGYSSWVLARAERARQAAASEARRQNLLRKELAWLRRGPPARTSKPKFRIDAANALIADEPPVRDNVELRRFATARLGRSVYDAEDIQLRTPDGRELLGTTTWRIGPGDRVALMGPNGSGKTTLLRTLAGQRAPDDGSVEVGRTVKVAYLSQDAVELPGGLRVLEAVQEVAGRLHVGKRELTAGQLAEMFGFGTSSQWTPVADLSGGQRRRLQLLRLLMGEPNVLLLDEPTNDLDTDTLAALEDLLDSWPGTLVVVSHDRYLIERVCDTVYALLGDGRLTMLPGGVAEYLERREKVEQPATAAKVAPAAPVGMSAGEQRQARKELSRLERELAKLAETEQRLLADLAEHAADHERVIELDARLRDVRLRVEATEERWLLLGEQIEG